MYLTAEGPTMLHTLSVHMRVVSGKSPLPLWSSSCMQRKQMLHLLHLHQSGQQRRGCQRSYTAAASRPDKGVCLSQVC